MIKDVLGQGGFGITYKALNYQTGEFVAIKEYYPRTIVTRNSSYTVLPQTGQNERDFEYGKSQFLEEAKTLSEFIGNPAVVKVYSYFEENGTAYFVMEFLEGVSLTGYLSSKGGRVSWQEAWDLLLPLMDALSAVHEKNIVHRDIKPDNIVITNDGATKLLDFGAARYIYGVQSHSLEAILTPGFAPMEQYFRRGHQGSWTDVYALAATMYCAITGVVPPEAAERSYEDTLIKPASMGIIIPDYAETALLKALSIREKDRYRTIYEFKNTVLNGIRREEEEKKKKEQQEALRRQEEEKRKQEEEKRKQEEEKNKKEEQERIKAEQRKKAEEENQLRKEQEEREVELRIRKKIEKETDEKDKEIQRLKEEISKQSEQKKLDGKDKEDQYLEKETKKEDLQKKSVQKKTQTNGNGNKVLIAVLLAAAAIVCLWFSGVFSNSSRTSGNNGKITETASGQIDSQTAPEEAKGTSKPDTTGSETDDTDNGTRRSSEPIALTDSWDEIITAGKDGTYKDKYRIGDTNELDLGEEGIVNMKLAAIDADELADGSGKATMTWIAVELINSEYHMNPNDTNKGGWPESEMRIWLRESIMPLFPENVKSNIKEVTKYTYSETSTISSKDTIWIPSMREVAGAGGDSYEPYSRFTICWENRGPMYISAFPNNKT